MDFLMIDLTDINLNPNQMVGVPVELFGQNLKAEELANLAGTISYEILTSIGERVPRMYIK